MRIIANPLYDAVFKHLMSNEKLACKVLSILLGKNVVAVRPTPQEVVAPREKGLFSIYRMDYRAVIQDEQGQAESVHIEVQKSRLATNILRFRHYLSRLYAETPSLEVKEPVFTVKEPAAEYGILPIITIYLLGYGVSDIPYQAIRANHRIVDLNTGQEVSDVGSDFLGLLTHTTYVIQVGRQPKEPKTSLERLLMFFDQRLRVPGYGYLLNLPYVPEGFEDLAEYLMLAAMRETDRNVLEGELLLELEIGTYEREIEVARKEREDAYHREQEARQREQEARQRELEARAVARRVQEASARTLLKHGLPVEEIARITGLTEEEVRAL